MSRVVIFGGHGRVALHLERLLVERGDEVTAVIRNPAHFDDVAVTGATPVVLDVEDADVAALSRVIAGHDAVVWSAGAGGGDPRRTYAIDRDAAIRTMAAAEAAGVGRYVMVSWLGSHPGHGVAESDSFYPYADAKLAADESLRASGLDATILGPGTLTSDPPTGRIEIDPEGSGRVSRSDVAAVAAAALADRATIGRTIRFGGGDVPIAEALTHPNP